MPAKIEDCPFNRGIRCRKSALVRRLTRSILSRDSPPRRDSPHWIETMIGKEKRRFYLSDDCLECYYRPKPVEETKEIILDEATVEGYRALYEASKKVHAEEPEEEDEDYGDITSMNTALLDSLSPGRWCWAELVFWSLDTIPWSEVDAPNHCGYCGACEEATA